MLIGSQDRGATPKGLFAFMRVMFLTIRSALALPWGIWRYRRSGRTPESALQAMIWLFCVSGGRFNDFVSKRIARRRPPIRLPDCQGVLGNLDEKGRAPLLERLKRDGYLVFPAILPPEACDRLQGFASRAPSLIRRMDNEAAGIGVRKAIFEPERPQAVRYDYEPSDLLNLADVQDLLADHSILALMQEYLDCEPVADVLSMWWHTSFHAQPDAEAAQFFHFDMDRFRWLKVFIYLTEVGPENGPHSFVRGTHRTGAIPAEILHRGYVRITDDEVAQAYDRKDVLAFSAPRGSIIIEDTRGLHKGAVVTGYPRLILQLQFSNSLFGTNYPRATMAEVKSPRLKSMLQLAPAIYRQYAPR